MILRRLHHILHALRIADVSRIDAQARRARDRRFNGALVVKVDVSNERDLRRARSPAGRLTWVGEFVSPLTQRRFLSEPTIQYRTFVDSVKLYIDGLRAGTVAKPDGGFPCGMSLSGALAVLHRGGPGGLKNWGDESRRFDDTVALYERANGIF